MKLKYPLKKYLLPWFLLFVNTITLVRLGNLAFTILAMTTTLILYLVLRLAAKQIEKRDKEIDALKKLVLRNSN